MAGGEPEAEDEFEEAETAGDVGVLDTFGGELSPGFGTDVPEEAVASGFGDGEEAIADHEHAEEFE